MKRFVVLLLCLTLSLGCALAETAAATLSFTPRGCYVSDTEYTYQVPQEWFDVDISEDDAAWGVIGSYENEEQTITLTVTLEESSAAITFAKLAESMSSWEGYTEVSQVMIGGKTFITYRLAKDNVDGLLYLMDDAIFDKPLLLHFDFVLTDRTDSAAIALAAEIASTIAPPAQDEPGA